MGSAFCLKTMEQLLYLAIGLGGASLLASILLFIYCFQIGERVTKFFRRGDANFEAMLDRQIKDLVRQDEDMKSIHKEIGLLKEFSQISFRKMAFMRFNPFQDVGSDQSFILVMLDANNSGIVFTSHFGRDFNKIYGKPIVEGKCEYQLSEEEKKVLSQAMAKR